MPGVPPDAFGLLEDSFKGIVAHNLSFKAHRRLPRKPQAVASTTVAHLSSDEDDTTNDEEAQQRTADLQSVTSPSRANATEETTPSTNPHLIRQRSGLPPTPPSGSSAANDAEVVMAERESADPLFADGVRNALESKRSGLSTPTPTSRNPQSPPTPDASPPSTSTSRDQLRPDGHASNNDMQRPTMHHAVSEYAESFRTATEGLTTPVDEPSEPEQEPTADWEQFVSFIHSTTTSAEPTPPHTRAGEELGGRTRMSWNATPPEFRRRSAGATTVESLDAVQEKIPIPEQSEPTKVEESQAQRSPTTGRRISDGLGIFHVTTERGKRPETPPHRREIAKEARMAGRVSSIKKQGGWKVSDVPEMHPSRNVAKEALEAKRHTSMRADGTLETWARKDLEEPEVERTGKSWRKSSESHTDESDTPRVQQDEVPAVVKLERQDTEVTQFEEDEAESPVVGRTPGALRLNEAQAEAGAHDDEPQRPINRTERASMLEDGDMGLRTELFDEPEAIVADDTADAHANQAVDPTLVELPPSPPGDLATEHETHDDIDNERPVGPHNDGPTASSAVAHTPSKARETPLESVAAFDTNGMAGITRSIDGKADMIQGTARSTTGLADESTGAVVSDPNTEYQHPKVVNDPATDRAVVQTVSAEPQRDFEAQGQTHEDAHSNNIIDATVNNDALYKHIRTENMRRMSALTDGNAIQASIIETRPQRSHTLRRSRKIQSLREDSDSGSGKEHNVVAREHSLRHKKAMEPRRQTSTTVPPPTANVSRKLQDNQLTDKENQHDQREARVSAATVSKREVPSHADRDIRSARPHERSADKSSHMMNGHKLRRSLRDDGLDRNFSIKRNSMSSEEPSSPTLRQVRHFSKEERLENNPSVRRNSITSDHTRQPSIDSAALPAAPPAAPLASPRRLEVGHARLRSNSTPFSVVSDRSDMEVCEAKGVAIFPHNNDSLLVVQQGSRPLDRQEASEAAEGLDLLMPHSYSNGSTRRGTVETMDTMHEENTRGPVFTARLETATPPLGMGNADNAVESPLRNPRKAPQPPVIQFIPPTPNEEEEDRQLTMVESLNLDHPARAKRPGVPVRRESLKDKARRLSESYVMQPLFGRQTSTRSVGPKKVVTVIEERETNLHPFWKPRYFFSEFESDSEDYFDDEDYDVLPRGGDTSDHPTDSTRRGSLLPRGLSLRKPRRASSQGSLRHRTTQTDTGMKRSNTIGSAWKSRHGKVVTLPGGSQLEYVGLTPFRQRMNSIRLAKEEREAEKRRARLRNQIGYRVYHG